jgi:DNA-binding response OmpR family regulator
MPRILVCDDEPHILHAVSIKLRAAGYEVLQAADGSEAIRAVQLVVPDFVITDYQMPEVDGFELCQYLRSRPATAQVPIIMLTARALEMDEFNSQQQFGLSAIMMKPFSPRALVEAVSQRLAGAARRPEPVPA